MLELLDVPLTGRNTAYASEQIKKGSFIVISGVFSAAQITALPDGQKNKAGWAQAGYKRAQPAYAGGGRAFPANKFYFEREDADDDHDTIAAGEALTYYTDEGTYRTTEFTDLTTPPVAGNYLKLTASGTLTEEDTLTTQTENSVAIVEGLFTSHTAAKKHRLAFRTIGNMNNV